MLVTDDNEALVAEKDALTKDKQRLESLVSYDRLKLIWHIRKLEDGIARMRRFLRHDGVEESAESVAQKHWNIYMSRERACEKGHVEFSLRDAIALVLDGYRRGAAMVAMSTSVRWRPPVMPRQPEEGTVKALNSVRRRSAQMLMDRGHLSLDDGHRPGCDGLADKCACPAAILFSVILADDDEIDTSAVEAAVSALGASNE